MLSATNTIHCSVPRIYYVYTMVQKSDNHSFFPLPDIMIQFGLCTQAAKGSSYPIMCRLSHFLH